MTAAAREAGAVAPARGGQDLRADEAARTVRPVEDESNAGGRNGRREAQAMLAVVVEPGPGVDRPADLRVPWHAELLASPDQLLELILNRVVELESLAIEHLEAIVVGRIVRGRDHDPGSDIAPAGEVGERGGRDDPNDVDVHAQAGRSGRDRGHEHVPRSTSVLADDDRSSPPDQAVRDGSPEGVGGRRLQVDVGNPADAVRAEEAGHRRFSPRPGTSSGTMRRAAALRR